MENSGQGKRRGLPDMKICRAERVSDDVADCLVEAPVECQYAFALGNGYFCRHPERGKIVQNTEKGQRP
jgi:hypothetical protein